MGHLARPSPCALQHGSGSWCASLSSHVCVSEGHGLVKLCNHHAGQHRRRRGHVVFTLEQGWRALSSLAKRAAKEPRDDARDRIVRRWRRRMAEPQ